MTQDLDRTFSIKILFGRLLLLDPMDQLWKRSSPILELRGKIFLSFRYDMLYL